MSRRSKLILAAATAVAAAAIATPALTAASAAPPRPPLCRSSDVSFYYGAASEGLGHRSFQITLTAHDAVTCRLEDRPLIHLFGPPKQQPIPVSIIGRHGVLVLTPGSPLHTTVYWSAPDRPSNTLTVRSLTLRMPGGGFVNHSDFLYPGDVQIARNIGVTIDAWTTGAGVGVEGSAY